MIGAIAGDIIGSEYEFHNISWEDFDFFGKKSTYTDDSILTVATADAIMDKAGYAQYYLDYAQAFPNRGWGGNFLQMVKTGKLVPYNSYGNGSAMRVSPVGWACNSVKEVMEEAKKTAEVSHDHPEGIKGAQATALAIFMARSGKTKEEIKKAIEVIGYNLSMPLKDYDRSFDESCQGTLPKCFAIFLETDNYEQAIRKSIACGGDVDTIGCIVGGICQAYYGMPSRDIVESVYKKIPPHLAKITTAFTQKYIDREFVEPTIIGVDGATYL
jgi:ADP-ribosyl-[dinitrogen reductase] hydrolase